MRKVDMSDCPNYMKDFITQLQAIEGKSQNTVNEYYYDLRTFLRFIKVLKNLASFDDFENIKISDVSLDTIKSITQHDLFEFISYASRERLNSAGARARKVTAVKTFFKYLNIKANLIPDNPAKNLDSPKIPKTLPKYMTLEESITLLKSIDGTYRYRDFAIITLFLNCGLRLSELTGININDVKKDTLTVKGKGNKERVVYLNNACVSAIGDYIKKERPKDGIKSPDDKALFISRQNKRIGVSMVQKLVEKHIKAAGLDRQKFSVHKLRHTAATLMHKYGKVDVRVLQEILGHTNLSTTQIYTHLDNEQLRNASEANPLSHFMPEITEQEKK